MKVKVNYDILSEIDILKDSFGSAFEKVNYNIQQLYDVLDFKNTILETYKISDLVEENSSFRIELNEGLLGGNTPFIVYKGYPITEYSVDKGKIIIATSEISNLDSKVTNKEDDLFIFYKPDSIEETSRFNNTTGFYILLADAYSTVKYFEGFYSDISQVIEELQAIDISTKEDKVKIAPSLEETSDTGIWVVKS